MGLFRATTERYELIFKRFLRDIVVSIYKYGIRGMKQFNSI